jgi:polyisoprenoid-binding protein YceI
LTSFWSPSSYSRYFSSSEAQAKNKPKSAQEQEANKWDATLTYTSAHAEDGVKKSEDFFDVEQDPYITFHSSKIVQTGPNTFDIQDTFTIRGVSKPETLHLTVVGTKGSGHGEIK